MDVFVDDVFENNLDSSEMEVREADLEGLMYDQIFPTNWRIDKLTILHQPHLEFKYKLKKTQFSRITKFMYARPLYHDTTREAVQAILKNDPDWRSIQRRHYPNGFNFGTSIEYAAKYNNGRNEENERVLIAMDVLIINEVERVPGTIGWNTMEYGTLKSVDGNVFVKFSSDEFNPKFMVYYTRMSYFIARDLYYMNSFSIPSIRSRDTLFNSEKNAKYDKMDKETQTDPLNDVAHNDSDCKKFRNKINETVDKMNKDTAKKYENYTIENALRLILYKLKLEFDYGLKQRKQSEEFVTYKNVLFNLFEKERQYYESTLIEMQEKLNTYILFTGPRLAPVIKTESENKDKPNTETKLEASPELESEITDGILIEIESTVEAEPERKLENEVESDSKIETVADSESNVDNEDKRGAKPKIKTEKPKKGKKKSKFAKFFKKFTDM